MIAVVFMALMVVVRPVHAHANLLRAVPAHGSTVDGSPGVVYAEFTEELDHSFSRIEVLTAEGEAITNGPTEPDPTNAAAMLVPIRPLGDGSYVVVWRSLSVVDGHIIRGSFAFGVGEPVAPGMAVALATVESSPLASISRGLLFISICVAPCSTCAVLSNSKRGGGSRENSEFIRDGRAHARARASIWRTSPGLIPITH